MAENSNVSDTEKSKFKDEHENSKQIPEEDLEFGGTFGAIGLIIFSHWVLYYFWYAFEVNDGKLVIPGGNRFTPNCITANQSGI